MPLGNKGHQLGNSLGNGLPKERGGLPNQLGNGLGNTLPYVGMPLPNRSGSRFPNCTIRLGNLGGVCSCMRCPFLVLVLRVPPTLALRLLGGSAALSNGLRNCGLSLRNRLLNGLPKGDNGLPNRLSNLIAQSASGIAQAIA